MEQTVAARTPIYTSNVRRAARNVTKYWFRLTLEDGSVRTLAGYANSKQEAETEALCRSGRVIEHGYQEGM